MKLDELIQLLMEYREVTGNIEVKFEAFEYGGLEIDMDPLSRTKIMSYDGKRYLNIELK